MRSLPLAIFAIAIVDLVLKVIIGYECRCRTSRGVVEKVRECRSSLCGVWARLIIRGLGEAARLLHLHLYLSVIGLS